MPLLVAADLTPYLKLCEPNLSGVVIVSDKYSLKVSLTLKYELPLVFDDLTLFWKWDTLMESVITNI